MVLRLANSKKNASDNIVLFVRFKDESYVSLGMYELNMIRVPTHDLLSDIDLA